MTWKQRTDMGKYSFAIRIINWNQLPAVALATSPVESIFLEREESNYKWCEVEGFEAW
jgi:hypothetical protein